jgi:hypothetical protein
MELRFVLSFALPDCDDLEASPLQRFLTASVSLAVRCEFAQPEFAIPLRNGGAFAPFMMVPEAAVDEDGPASGSIRDIGTTRQISVVLDPEALAEPMEFTADDQFRFGPALWDQGESCRRLRVHDQTSRLPPPRAHPHASSFD